MTAQRLVIFILALLVVVLVLAGLGIWEASLLFLLVPVAIIVYMRKRDDRSHDVGTTA